MAITYPLDLLANWPGWSTEFALLYRQEQSRQANGRTLVKDFGSPLWQASYTTRSLRPNELDEWRARLASLENGLQTFRGYALSRCRPQAHPGNGALATGNLLVIRADRKSIQVNQLTPNMRLTVGDMIQMGDRDLHQVMETRTAVSTGWIDTDFEVRPHIWPGVTTNTPVSVVKPSCVMTVVPGSISSTADLATGRGAVSFQAIEAR
ncbi:hypothetical protein [Mesorhizobium sp. CAU 1732]|uniref:hypothetical protein n=1 Tax=Mesorhizobium sp. CAU 1732 TaxID=3140358 RepID=UPI0032602B1C